MQFLIHAHNYLDDTTTDITVTAQELAEIDLHEWATRKGITTLTITPII